MPRNNLHYFHPDWIKPSQRTLRVDLCVYGGTSAGVIAAITGAQRRARVVLLNPGLHLGGMTSGGLGWTDFGRKYVIGGQSRQFYRDLGKHYGKEEEWQFEPHVAEDTYKKYIAAHDVEVLHAQFLDKLEMDGGRIRAITTLGGLRVEAHYFIDATYEGDLLAAAKVSYHVGREANSVYGETLNGIQVLKHHQFSHPVDPYVKPGDASSGLLPFVEAEDLRARIGQGDTRVQAYNFRVCMTDDPELKIAWAKPAAFDERQYVLASRWFNSDKDGYNEQLNPRTGVINKVDIFPNKTARGFHKTDTNNHGPVSSDFIGANWAWPDGCYESREKIFQSHVAYQRGLYWFLANDPSIPQRYRDAYARWGLAKDEFADTDHWPHQLYVREARRMIGDYVITEHDCTGKSRPNDPVGMGSYNMDSHNCTRFVAIDDGKPRVLNDGDVQVPPTDPYPISYRCVIPKKGQCANLLVPVCMSSSHIAYGSARMEPVFMVLGESCAIAAALCLADNRCATHDLPYNQLGPELLNAQQVLKMPEKR